MLQTWWRGRPTIDGKTARGASSPPNPALHIPEPLSTTSASISSAISDRVNEDRQQTTERETKFCTRTHIHVDQLSSPQTSRNYVVCELT